MHMHATGSPKTLSAVTGMNDILPAQTPLWHHLEATARTVLESYHYQEIRFPIVEYTELFQRSIGDVTDIVEKEMFTFIDRETDSLTLRPEGTAVCVRAGIANGLLYNQIQRLWYMGPMFRHEKPQYGRYRQFHQIGAEAFGMEGPIIDAELILVTARLWRLLKLDNVALQINSLGTGECRAAYRQHLQDYFTRYEHDLDDDSRKRLHRNPLRILDSKNEKMQAIITGAPALLAHLDSASAAHFERLQQLLSDANIVFEINPRLVRGLDYYTKTVFEWVTTELGSQGTVCAGGRYDGLVAHLGGKSTPGIGFAMGMERLLMLLETQGTTMTPAPDLYLISMGAEANSQALVLAEQLRDAFPDLRIMTDAGAGGFKNQFKRADKSQAGLALILGEEEIANGLVGVKFLRESLEQQTVKREELITWLRNKME